MLEFYSVIFVTAAMSIRQTLYMNECIMIFMARANK